MAKIIQFPNNKVVLDKPVEEIDLNERFRRIRESLKRCDLLLEQLKEREKLGK
jgi:hypothetical protein